MGVHFIKCTPYGRASHIRVLLIGVYLTVMHRIGVCLTGVYLMGMHLTGVYLTGMHPTGMHPIGGTA
jgi:hypothetical protein